MREVIRKMLYTAGIIGLAMGAAALESDRTLKVNMPTIEIPADLNGDGQEDSMAYSGTGKRTIYMNALYKGRPARLRLDLYKQVMQQFMDKESLEGLIKLINTNAKLAEDKFNQEARE